MDAEPLSFLGRRLNPSFVGRMITIPVGRSRLYDAAEWDDSLVVVERGEVHLECRAGRFRSFASGEVLWLVGLPLRALHNRGAEPVVLMSVSRRAPEPEH